MNDELKRILQLSGVLNESVNPIDNQNGAGVTSNNKDVDYFGKSVMMKPSTFLKLAAHIDTLHSKSGLIKYMQEGGKVASPMLTFDMPDGWREGDFTKPAEISGHEGRNRMSAIKDLYGDIEVETHIFIRGLRSRHLNDEILMNINSRCLSEDGHLMSGPFFDGPFSNNGDKKFEPTGNIRTIEQYKSHEKYFYFFKQIEKNSDFNITNGYSNPMDYLQNEEHGLCEDITLSRKHTYGEHINISPVGGEMALGNPHRDECEVYLSIDLRKYICSDAGTIEIKDVITYSELPKYLNNDLYEQALKIYQTAIEQINSLNKNNL